MLTTSELTYKSITEAYTAILKAKPGQALTYTSFAAVMIQGGQLRLALMQNSVIDLGTACDMTEDRWDHVRNCWVDHASVEVTAATASFPVLLEVSGKTIATFNARAIQFEFEGDCIQDPTLSECGRFTTSPSYYGFSQLPDEVWNLSLPDGNSIQLNGQILTLVTAGGEITGRVLLSEIAFNSEIEPEEILGSRLPETLASAARTTSGMIEYAVPSLTADAVAEGFKLGLFEIIGNGVAQITEQGKHKVAKSLSASSRP